VTGRFEGHDDRRRWTGNPLYSCGFSRISELIPDG
jgi:hypothetical protein